MSRILTASNCSFSSTVTVPIPSGLRTHRDHTQDPVSWPPSVPRDHRQTGWGWIVWWWDVLLWHLLSIKRTTQSLINMSSFSTASDDLFVYFAAAWHSLWPYIKADIYHHLFQLVLLDRVWHFSKVSEAAERTLQFSFCSFGLIKQIQMQLMFRLNTEKYCSHSRDCKTNSSCWCSS